MEEVQRYLATGEHDYLHPGWSGDLLTTSRMAEEALQGEMLPIPRLADERLDHAVARTSSRREPLDHIRCLPCLTR
jgi:hypothetical protein